MFNFDLRAFGPQNRGYFWEAAQKALTELKIHEGDQEQGVILNLTLHKRINKGEDPMALNHMRMIEPEPNEKLGPG